MPRGALLVGLPRLENFIGKSNSRRSWSSFLTISGSDFVGIGVGASRVRDMFEQGKKNSPCIIFIDEIDAVGRSRSWFRWRKR